MIKKILSASAILAFAATTAAGAASNSTTIAANLNLQGICSVTPPSNGFSFGSLTTSTSTQTPTSNVVPLAYACTGTTAPIFNLYDSTSANSASYTLTGAIAGNQPLTYFVDGTIAAAPASFTGTPLENTASPAANTNAGSGLALASATGTIELIAQATVPAATPADNYSDLLTATVTL